MSWKSQLVRLVSSIQRVGLRLLGLRLRVLLSGELLQNLTLNKNIELNGLDDRVSALCLALSDDILLDRLNMGNTELGGALSGFASTEDYKGDVFTPAFRQGGVGFSIDGFNKLFDPPFPNHIKIDVDGIEHEIVTGARATLADSRLRSVSIELDDDKAEEIEDVMAAMQTAGLTFQHKKHAPMFEGTPYAGSYNYVFVREDNLQ